MFPQNACKLTIAVDDKTVRSTAKMSSYEHQWHIIRAQLFELGITLGQVSA